MQISQKQLIKIRNTHLTFPCVLFGVWPTKLLHFVPNLNCVINMDCLVLREEPQSLSNCFSELSSLIHT